MVDKSQSKNPPLRGRASAVDLQHRRYAKAAVDHGRQAAEALLLRQSQLRLCIRQIRCSIGMIVFERSSSGVRATQASEQSIRTVRLILFGQIDALVTSAHSTCRGEASGLAIGFHRLPSYVSAGLRDTARTLR